MQTSHKKFFLFSLILCILGIFVISGYLLWRLSAATEKVIYQDEGSEQTLFETVTDLAKKPDVTTLDGYDDGRINILLLGIAGSETEKDGAHLTDTIIVASINTAEKRAALLSLPRDLLIPTTTGSTKINSLYEVGLKRDRYTELTRKAVSHVTGLPIHYDLVMDFAGFESIVDSLGGINITVPREIYDERYPGPGYSYETFHITEGFHVLDGETALKYARTRYEDPESDFGRAKRQQVILSAIRNKALSREMLKPHVVTELLSALEDNVRTSISTEDIRSLITLVKGIDTQNITNVVYDAWQPESLLVGVNQRYGRGVISGLSPRTGTWAETRRTADEIFERTARMKRQEEIVAEDPTLIVITPTNMTSLVRDRLFSLLSEAGFVDVTFSEDQSSSQKKSTIFDHSGGTHPFSLDEIVSRLGAVLTDQEPAPTSSNTRDDATIGTPTLTLILGTKLIKDLSYEEISRDALADTPDDQPLSLTK